MNSAPVFLIAEQKMVLSDAQLAAVRALELKDVEENALTVSSIAHAHAVICNCSSPLLVGYTCV